MSGGEWQRLALARALFGVAGGAGLLILDEPTASLDVRGEAAVYQRFLELTRGVTTIVISHRFSTVRRADRIIVVEGGQVIEDGTHDELAHRPNGRYAEMYALQASRFAGGADADAACAPLMVMVEISMRADTARSIAAVLTAVGSRWRCRCARSG